MKTTLGVIFGNRDFFPDHLVSEARQDILALFQEMNIDGVMLGEQDTKLGSVETYAHAKACAELFKANGGRMDGILVILPNMVANGGQKMCLSKTYASIDKQRIVV